MITFLNPLAALIPKIPFSFCQNFFLVRFSFGWIFGGPAMEPFGGGG